MDFVRPASAELEQEKRSVPSAEGPYLRSARPYPLQHPPPLHSTTAPPTLLALWNPYGLSTNPVLQRVSEPLLAETVRRWDETHETQRLFAGFWYQAGTWSVPRWVVVKTEANVQGTNRRFVTTNRPGALAYPEATYDEYVM